MEVDILNKTGHTRRSADILIQLLAVSEHALGVFLGGKQKNKNPLFGSSWTIVDALARNESMPHQVHKLMMMDKVWWF